MSAKPESTMGGDIVLEHDEIESQIAMQYRLFQTPFVYFNCAVM